MRFPTTFSLKSVLAVALGLASQITLIPSTLRAQGLHEEEPLASRSIREQQWTQWNRYLAALPSTVDFSSPEVFARTIAPVRRRFQQQVGFPPPRIYRKVKARLARFAEDAVATYYRCYVPVSPELETYGLYIVPKSAKLPAPLVISQHGGGGSPEMATFKGGANYHDMVRGAVARGYVVFAPLLIVYPYIDRDHGTPIPSDVRQTLSEELAWRGTSLGTIEAAKISRALDALLKRREIDPRRVAMIGLSLGGSHTVLTTALDPRIRVAVVAGAPWLDNSHLICPRPVQIQFGDKDKILSGVGIHHKATAKRVEKLYQRLGIPDRFEFKIFDGGHEFRGDMAWEFLKKHL